MLNLNKNKDGDRPKRVAFYKKKSFKYGSLATGFTAAFVVLLILLNMAVSWLSTRYPISVDLTTKQTYKIDNKSVNFIKGLKQDISIDILASKEEYLAYSSSGVIIKILEQFPQYDHNITINYVDLTKNPTYAASYSKESLQPYDLIVRTGDRYKHISINDLILTQTDQSTGSQSITGYDVENQVDTALLYITTNDLPTVTFTTGHGEIDSTPLQGLLTKNNYQVETKTIASDGLDKNAKALMIVDPKNDFSTDDIKKIDDYLNNGGAEGKNLIVLFDPQQSPLPNLENYVKEWGISVGKGAIYDSTNSVNSSPFQVLSGTYDTTFFKNLPSGENADIILARPLTPMFQTKDSFKTTSLLSTMSTSSLWDTAVVSQDTVNTFKSSDSDPKGPFTVLAEATNTLNYNNTAVTSNVLVSGSTYAFNQTDLFTAPSYYNANIILDAVNTLVGFKSPLNVVSKSTSAVQLNIPAAQQRFIMILFMLILPLAVLILGLIVWLRRRHL